MVVPVDTSVKLAAFSADDHLGEAVVAGVDALDSLCPFRVDDEVPVVVLGVSEEVIVVGINTTYWRKYADGYERLNTVLEKITSTSLDGSVLSQMRNLIGNLEKKRHLPHSGE